MKLAMANIAEKLKVVVLIMKSIPIFMMNYLASFKFAAKMLFHHPTVLEWPLPGRSYLNGDVFPECAIGFLPGSDNPFCEHGQGLGMIHSSQFSGFALKPESLIPANPKAFFTLGRVVKTVFVSSLARCNRLATNATWFVCQFLHNVSYTPAQTHCQG
jgi:hypothetical protein